MKLCFENSDHFNQCMSFPNTTKNQTSEICEVKTNLTLQYYVKFPTVDAYHRPAKKFLLYLHVNQGKFSSSSI